MPNRILRRITIAAALIAVLGSLTGCATGPSPIFENDPYEPANRVAFDSSKKVNRIVIRPLVQVYVDVVPSLGRAVVHNILTNLDCPVVLANDGLQGDVSSAKDTIMRCAANSILGLGGLFNVARQLGVSYHENDFGLTLARWGMGEGPYLFIPLLGPSNPRDLTGVLVDIAFQPEMYASLRYKAYWEGGRFGLQFLDDQASDVGNLKDIERASIDLYAVERNIYRQHRDDEISRDKARSAMPDF